MSSSLIHAITDYGDTAVLLPITLLVFAGLRVLRSARVAWAWAGTIGACLVAMAILKIGFNSCGHAVFDGRILSPSGHAAFSAAVYGSLAWLVARQFTGWGRAVPLVCSLVLIAAIAASRLVLQVHTMPEVVLGLAVGSGSAALFALTAHRATGERREIWGVLLIGGVVLAVLHGRHLPVEQVLQEIAWTIRSEASVCS